MECFGRLQRAIDYFEDNLEGTVSLETAAAAACYSRSHFCWIFKAATGLSPIEYVRERRLTLAATAIVQGCDIADTVYRFGFSAQDAFTRSFKRKFGSPPGRYRSTGGRYENLTPRLKLNSEGDTMILRYSGRMEDYSASARLHRFLSDDIKDVISAVATGPLRTTDLDSGVLDALKQAAVVKIDGDLVKLNCTVFLEPDIELALEAALTLGEDLALMLESAITSADSLSDTIKHFIVDTLVADTVSRCLVDEGLAFDWRTVSGRYANCEVHFDEVCDAFDSAGPYSPNTNGSVGEQYSFIAISNDDAFSFSSFMFGASMNSDVSSAEAFMLNTEQYLTDSFAKLILGQIESESLKAAAEAALLYDRGNPVAEVILNKDAEPYLNAAAAAKEAARSFVSNHGGRLLSFLKCTNLHKIHGVAPQRSTTHFMRYVARAAAQKLHADGFFSGDLEDRGLLALFYEKTIDFQA